MQIYNILGISTLEVNTGTKTCACIFLPTSTMNKHSRSYCSVNPNDGTISDVEDSTELKFSVVLESNWALYRQKAIRNYNKLFNSFSNENKLLQTLSNWVKALPKNINAIKLFYGGDISELYIVDAVNSLANEYKDKLFYMQTCNHSLIGKAYRKIKNPAENLVIGLEVFNNKNNIVINNRINHVFVHYEHNTTATYEDDLHFIPVDLNEKHVRINNPNVCILAKKYKRPIFDVLMDTNIPRHEFEKLCI